MALFFQQIINAVAIGGIYALMSVGYALIYSLLRFTNFAHSVAVTFGSYAIYVALTHITSNFYLGLLFGVLVGAAVALLIEITAYKPLLIKNSARSSLTIIGLDPVKCLDVSVLQDYILDPILGIRNPKADPRIHFVGGIRGLEALREMADRSGGIAFSMYPTSMEELLAVADAGRLMPPKSTWFEPKLRSGLFIHRF